MEIQLVQGRFVLDIRVGFISISKSSYYTKIKVFLKRISNIFKACEICCDCIGQLQKNFLHQLSVSGWYNVQMSSCHSSVQIFQTNTLSNKFQYRWHFCWRKTCKLGKIRQTGSEKWETQEKIWIFFAVC